MYCSLLRIQFTSSTQIKPLQIAFRRTANILYLLASAWHRLALFNSNTLMMLWWLMKGCVGQRFCNAVVWIAELVRVKKT